MFTSLFLKQGLGTCAALYNEVHAGVLSIPYIYSPGNVTQFKAFKKSKDYLQAVDAFIAMGCHLANSFILSRK